MLVDVACVIAFRMLQPSRLRIRTRALFLVTIALTVIKEAVVQSDRPMNLPSRSHRYHQRSTYIVESAQEPAGSLR